MNLRSIIVSTGLLAGYLALGACSPPQQPVSDVEADVDTLVDARDDVAEDVAASDGEDDSVDMADASDVPDVADTPGETDASPSDWVTHTLDEDPSAILNPERGVYGQVGLGHTFEPADQSGQTLARLVVRLDDYRQRDLDAALLDQLEASFQSARTAGIKLVPRFAYNAGPWPDSEPDASLQQILRHIDQLEPVLDDNAALIAFFEAGFIGAWGEWHTSTHGLDESDSAKRQIVAALLDVLPEDRAVLLRYPPDLYEVFDAPAQASARFDGSDTARLGHTNDCFLASETDRGTYGRSSRTIEEEKTLITDIGEYAPVGGETCAPNPPRSDCQTALAELEQLRWTYLNEAYHPDVIDGFKHGDSQGARCWDQIRTRLGYRYVVGTVRHPETLAPGAGLEVELEIRNDGWARAYTKRAAYLVLTSAATTERLDVDLDPRLLAAGTTENLTLQVQVPAELPAGSYALHLWLPDASPDLRDDPRYAIRLANQGTWDAETGYNRLSPNVMVE